MEPEGSLPHLQDPSTYPYPEPDQSSPCPHTTSWRSMLILSSHLRLGMVPEQNMRSLLLSVTSSTLVDTVSYFPTHLSLLSVTSNTHLSLLSVTSQNTSVTTVNYFPTHLSLLSVTSQHTSVVTVRYFPTHVCRYCQLLSKTHLSLLSVISQNTSVATVNYFPTHLSLLSVTSQHTCLNTNKSNIKTYKCHKYNKVGKTTNLEPFGHNYFIINCGLIFFTVT